MAEHTAHKIFIKHPGRLTERAKAAGVSLAVYEQEPHKDPAVKKEIQFAENAKKFHHGKKS
jgi:hypothetical protein